MTVGPLQPCSSDGLTFFILSDEQYFKFSILNLVFSAHLYCYRFTACSDLFKFIVSNE